MYHPRDSAAGIRIIQLYVVATRRSLNSLNVSISTNNSGFTSMVLYTRVSDNSYNKGYQLDPINNRDTMTTLLTTFSDVYAAVEGFGYIVMTIALAVVILKYTE